MNKIKSAPVLILLTLIKGYKNILSPLLPTACRYMPTCSDYSSEALSKYGSIKGTRLSVKRLSRCHPFGSKGYDPVP